MCTMYIADEDQDGYDPHSHRKVEKPTSLVLIWTQKPYLYIVYYYYKLWFSKHQIQISSLPLVVPGKERLYGYGVGFTLWRVVDLKTRQFISKSILLFFIYLIMHNIYKIICYLNYRVRPFI